MGAPLVRRLVRAGRSLIVAAAAALVALRVFSFLGGGAADGPAAGGAAAGAPSVRLAYFVQAYNASLPLVPRLLRALHTPDAVFAVHVDAKAKGAPGERELAGLLAEPAFANVRLLPPQPVAYRGVSMVLNTLDAIEALLARDPGWTHFINLSGQDYPLLRAADIAPAIAEASVSGAGRPLALSFVSFWAPTPRWRMLAVDPAVMGNSSDAIWQFLDPANTMPYPFNGSLLIPFEPARPMPHGDAWVILSRTFCEQLLAAGTELRRLLAFMAYVPSSPEHFFQAWIEWTAAGRQANASVARDAARFFDFAADSQHPVPITTDEQLARAVEGGALFARKFPGRSPLLDAIDGWGDTQRNRAKENAVARLMKAAEATAAYGPLVPVA
ncbi:core-2/I-branching enzyme-domain-containing protein [Hyaloraphidium curvatum]|nr:core-2/I-branching enzyme-domain-containing protein [Hyaloraphidium curvatum]